MDGSGDVYAMAQFVTAAEDIANLKLNLMDIVTDSDGTCDVDLGICVVSLSAPKLAVTGLPTGLKFDAKTARQDSSHSIKQRWCTG